MDKSKRNRSYGIYYENETYTRLTTPSTAEKIQDIRQKLEEVLESAYSKRSRNTPRSTKYRPLNDQFNSPLVSDRESRDQLIVNNRFNNDHALPVDAKLLAYNKFIKSLTRIIRDTHQQTSESISLSECLNTKNISLCTQKRSVNKNSSYLVQNDLFREPEVYNYKNQNIATINQAEKTTYCRPIACSQGCYNRTLEKNVKLQSLVKKLMQAREKEKQNEAWNNYINELKNKHGYQNHQTKNKPTLFGKEDEQILNIINDSYNVRHTWKQSNICEQVLNDSDGATHNVRDVSDIKRRAWCVPSTSKAYKYTNNSFCCPMSSQGRLMMIKRERCCPGYTLRPQRFFRGSAIVVEKQASKGKKTSVTKSGGTARSRLKVDEFENQAIQTTECDFSDGSCHDKDFDILDLTTKFNRVTKFAGKVKQKIKSSRDAKKQASLGKIEQKLDELVNNFNEFLQEMRLKKTIVNVKNEAVSCSSICKRHNKHKAKSDTYNVLSKPNVICEVATYKPHSSISFSPRPISQDTINDTLKEEIGKNEEVKKDIDDILSSNRCSVEIMIDIPTKDHSTEVTNSFYNRMKEQSTIIEEIEPSECEELDKMREIERSRSIARSMTIAVNTDPMGILALFRVSTETVKQILSYVPNLDYVTYLARWQLGYSTNIPRYVCNICTASFSRPSALSDHIHSHVDKEKSCCVCRHVLDRIHHRSGLFTCSYCGQMFTRAYCCELHERTCSKARLRAGARSSLIMLT